MWVCHRAFALQTIHTFVRFQTQTFYVVTLFIMETLVHHRPILLVLICLCFKCLWHAVTLALLHCVCETECNATSSRSSSVLTPLMCGVEMFFSEKPVYSIHLPSNTLIRLKIVSRKNLRKLREKRKLRPQLSFSAVVPHVRLLTAGVILGINCTIRQGAKDMLIYWTAKTRRETFLLNFMKDIDTPVL